MTDEIATADPPNHPHLPAERKRPGMPRTGEKPIKLTPAQENFLNAFLDTGKRAVAYRLAYKVKPDAPQDWVYTAAWRLLQNAKVLRRLEQLKATRAAAQIVNAQTLVAELDQARDIALEMEQPHTAIAATMGKARITGHLAAPEGGLRKGGGSAGQNGGVNAGVNITITFNQLDANLL